LRFEQALGEGFEVLAAASGEEVMAICAAQPGRVALALIDVRLPGVDGPETLAALRAADPAVTCCLTGGGVEDQEEGLLALGAVAVLAKPFDFATLADALRGLLKGA
jgi:DNA-binding response OmpR family regulator